MPSVQWDPWREPGLLLMENSLLLVNRTLLIAQVCA